MERRKRSANQEPVIVLDEEEKMEPIHKLLKLDRDKVKTIQSEMRTKGLVLSQTWSDLYSLMSRYQAELITREDQLIDIESQLDAQRNIARDNELERMKLQMQAKDREIKTIHMDMLNKSELLVKTQNELGRVKCLLRSKDDLIRKLQCEVKVEEDSVMAGDSPAEQVSTKTATSATSSSGTGTDTSSLIIEQTHLEEHVQTNFSRSGSDDSGTGAEKTDAKYQVSSSNDEETDSFLPLESDVATINIPGQDSGVLEEVQPGTSATDDTGQLKECSMVKKRGAKIKTKKLKSEAKPRIDDDIKPLLSHLKLTTVTTCQPPQPPQPNTDDIKPLMALTFSQTGKTPIRQRTEEASQTRQTFPRTDEIRPLMGGLQGRGGEMYPRKQAASPCQICGKVSYDRSSLNRHTRIHSGSKPYVCTHCGRAFSDPGNRWKHQRKCQRDFNYM
ncbi:ras-responsive element-binding protein 1-like isoform X5 [Lineus longissimus]|uniref:ras-responsive element-binding protein 1-like isoform X5 n=1 Tax=Lineus longissimus TaxID=88925 RepID=UPI00315DC00C